MTLTREDLKSFPTKTADIILEQQKRGWQGYMQSNGHVSFLAPDGETKLTISRNPNSHIYLKEDLTKYYRKRPSTEQKEKTMEHKIACPRPGCNRTYNSLDKLNVHMGVDHDGLHKCPECEQLFKEPKQLGAHRAMAHGYVSPRRAQRLAQKKAREERAKAATQPTQPTQVVEHVVLDERESWVIDLDKFQEYTVHQLREMYQASGLGMEIRIWKLSE